MTDAPPMDRLVRPPGILFNGTAFAIFVVAVWRGSERSGVLNSLVAVVAAWFFLLVFWLFRFAAAARVGTVTVRSIKRWLMVPALFAVAGFLAIDGRYAFVRDASGGSDSVVWYDPMDDRWSMEIVAFFEN